MELTCSRLGRDHYLAAATAAVLSVIGAPFECELLDGIDAGHVQQGRIGTAVVDIGSVHCPVVGSRTRAIDDHGTCICDSEVNNVRKAAYHSGLQGHQLLEITIIELQLPYLRTSYGR